MIRVAAESQSCCVKPVHLRTSVRSRVPTAGPAHLRGRHRLVELDAQRLGRLQRRGVRGRATEVVDELLDAPRRKHFVAEVTNRLTGGVQLGPSLFQPILDLDVRPLAAGLDVELVRGVHGDRVLHLPEQLLVIDDV